MEKKIFVFGSLGISPTDNCNYNCLHCSNGQAIKNSIKTNTIQNTFQDIKGINQLYFIGGEPFLYLDGIVKIIEWIIQNEIYVLHYGLNTNGSLYKKKIENIFNYFDEYIQNCRKKLEQDFDEQVSHINLSWGTFHHHELAKIKEKSEKLYELYCKRIQKLMNSKRAVAIDYMHGPIFNEGNAKELEIEKQEFQPLDIYTFDDSNKDINISNCMNIPLTFVGPSISILADGTVTDCDASLERAHSDLRYGNINEETLLDIIQQKASHCSTFKEFDEKQEAEYIKKMKL